jgi:hypothetical protein
VAEIAFLSQGIPDLLPSRDRSAGLHHSTVLSDWMVRSGYWTPKEREELHAQHTHSPGVISRMQLGLAFEDIIINRYSRHYPKRYIRSGEFDIDGLIITPDLIDLTDGSPDSIKLTWLSSRHEIGSDKFLYHWMQLKSECVALETDISRLHICHINGDYTYDQENPVHFNVWQGMFNKRELESHRTLILRHRDRMIREGVHQE